MSHDASPKIDGRRAKGDASRKTALTHAMSIAFSDGLEGLTFGRVATSAEMAKSSLQILFGDRERLQLQTLDAGVEEFTAKVIDAVRRSPDREKRPLWTLCKAWFQISAKADCGGCLLTSAVAEFSARTGAIHDAVMEAYGRWRTALRDAATRGVAAGELARTTDLDQLVFEILAMQAAANNRVEIADQAATRRAERAIRTRIEQSAP